MKSECQKFPTLSLGMILSSAPYFKKTFPAVCCGLIPIPLFVITALVLGFTLNFSFWWKFEEILTDSATNFMQVAKGASSGTLILIIITKNRPNKKRPKRRFWIRRKNNLKRYLILWLRLFSFHLKQFPNFYKSILNREIN